MPCLLDTSIVNSLAKYRLLNEALLVRTVQPADLLILRELHYQLLSNQGPKGPILDAATLTVAKNFCTGLAFLPSNPNESQDRKLLNTRNDNIWHEARRVKVDGGEANIFAATLSHARCPIWTADKKSLIALSLWPGCQHIHQRMLGTVFCLERMIRDLITAHGFGVIAPKIVVGYHSIDRAIGAGAGDCCKVLQDDEKKLQADCKGLLAP
jgi:hypothetical protein